MALSRWHIKQWAQVPLFKNPLGIFRGGKRKRKEKFADSNGYQVHLEHSLEKPIR